MATIGANNPTITDVTKRLDPQGKIDQIAEYLKQRNEILEDMTSVEGNLPTGHRVTVRTGYPSATWRMLNQGTDPDKSTTAQITEGLGELVSRGVVDVEAAKLNGNTAEFRASESLAFVESMNQTIAETLFYGSDVTEPGSFLGLAPRFNDLDAENGDMIIDAGGTGADDNSSIWLVVWGPQTVFSIFPKGSTAGLSHEDMGIDYVPDRDGKMFRAYQDHYMWKVGLAIRDWRYVVRIANINTAALTKDADSGADLLDKMVQALERVEDLNAGRPAFYCNRTLRSWLRRQTINHNNVRLGLDDVAGKKVLHFDEVPVRRVDKLLNTESRVVGSD